ncbi:unnamed protein product, partial [Vitis vinifera]|uniref:Uncharacterized protein n=1 Tax=Vitis vinifera TaxID=29760 RepID=D7UBT2_VITVI
MTYDHIFNIRCFYLLLLFFFFWEVKNLKKISILLLRFYSILLFTPLFSRLILQFQLQPQEFITGLPIFSCMLTTLSSGVALTQLAGGNSALALAMTVISNLLGILISLLQSYNFGAY